MSVYYIHAPALGLIKIGSAADPVERLRNMQTGSPTALVLLAIEVGSLNEEARRHVQFAELRRRGEWFAFEGALAEFVQALPPYQRRAKRFGPSEMSRLTGWSKSYCSMMLNDARTIPLERAAHVYRTCHLKLGALAEADDADCEALLRLCPPLAAEIAA